MTEKRQKGYKGLAMEGIVARWYTRIRRSGSQIENWRKQAAHLTGGLPDGADALEVAPGPGYFAIELARLDRLHVTGLDISHTFVEIARENARQAGASVDFQQGNASSMPFADSSFDLIICQAAFKNFSHRARRSTRCTWFCVAGEWQSSRTCGKMPPMRRFAKR